MKKFTYIYLMLIPFCFSLLSCSDDDNKDEESPDQTVIYSMNILNGGVINRDSVVEGTVDEVKKEITFPLLDRNTDLSDIQFETVVSDRAYIDGDVFNFTIAAGTTKTQKIIKVINGKRYREYAVTIGYDIPNGADFKKIEIFDHSAALGVGNIYPDLSGVLTRSASFDGKHALIVSRGSTGLHMLSLSNMLSNSLTPIKLNTTNVTGGTFAVSSGRLAHGHAYVCNLATASTSGNLLKIYHWADPANTAAAPQLAYSFDSNAISGLSGRYGDNMSLDLDAAGNGYIYLGSNPHDNIVRLKVTNFVTIGDPTVIPLETTNRFGSFISYNLNIESGNYVYTGWQLTNAPITLIEEGGAMIYRMTTTSELFSSASDARIITYNNTRYLIFVSASTPQTLYVYELASVGTVAEALETFDKQSEKTPEYVYSLAGTMYAGVQVASLGWGVSDDEKTLYLFASAPQAGFTLFSVPIKLKSN